MCLGSAWLWRSAKRRFLGYQGAGVFLLVRFLMLQELLAGVLPFAFGAFKRIFQIAISPSRATRQLDVNHAAVGIELPEPVAFGAIHQCLVCRNKTLLR